MKNNFYIYVDREGKMPVLFYEPVEIKSHPYYVKYINNRPVAYKGPLEVISNNGKFYCYDRKEYVPATEATNEN